MLDKLLSQFGSTYSLITNRYGRHSACMLLSLRTYLAFLSLAVAGLVRAEVGQMRPFPENPDHPADDARNHLPRIKSVVDAEFPADPSAKDRDDEVWVAFVVEKDGKTGQVRAFFGRHAEFEAAAVEAVKQWVFEPGVHEGRVVRTRMVVPIRFPKRPKAD
jgi:TonB family protein